MADKRRWNKVIQCDSLEECRLFFGSDQEKTEPVHCDSLETCRSLYECDQELTKLQRQFDQMDLILKDSSQQILEREEHIRHILRSPSWRIIAPLRYVHRIYYKILSKLKG